MTFARCSWKYLFLFFFFFFFLRTVSSSAKVISSAVTRCEIREKIQKRSTIHIIHDSRLALRKFLLSSVALNSCQFLSLKTLRILYIRNTRVTCPSCNSKNPEMERYWGWTIAFLSIHRVYYTELFLHTRYSYFAFEIHALKRHGFVIF